MDTKKLKKIIKTLIQSKKEGDFWDFKQQYPDNNVDFIHDILCLGNNTCEKDGLLIYGVKDATYKIIGISKDKNRKKQADIIDLLNNGCNFDGEIPKINLYTITIDLYEIDVWIIQHYKDTPYRLNENYNFGKKKLLKGITHTRRGDTNTPIEQGANISEMKLLWGKINIPAFKLSLIQDDENKQLHYISPKKIAVRNPLKRITNEELKANPNLSWRNSCGQNYFNHETLGTLPGGITDEDNISDEEIDFYNKNLPTQEQINKYNKEQTLYENAKHNCYNFYLNICNIGKSEANNIDIILSFPKGLLVFYKEDVKDIKEPEPLNFPNHPATVIKLTTGITSFNPTISILSKDLFSNRLSLANFNNENIFSKINFATPNPIVYNDNSAIQYKCANLLHTRNILSNTFSIIATKSGTFNIKYNIICKELSEAQMGILKLTFKNTD